MKKVSFYRNDEMTCKTVKPGLTGESGMFCNPETASESVMLRQTGINCGSGFTGKSCGGTARRNLFVRLSLILCLMLVTFALTACGSEKKTISSEKDLHHEGVIIGAGVGTEALIQVEKCIPEAEAAPFTSEVTGYEALKQGKIDAYVYERSQLEFAMANGLKGVKLLDENIGDPVEIAAGISRVTKVAGLTEDFNAFLQGIKDDGTLDDMYYRWIVCGRNDMPEIEKPTAPDHKLVVGTTGLVQPYSYYEGTNLTGFDLEMTYRYALYSNADVETKVYDYAGVVAAAESGTVDIILANLNATAERREVIDFSNPIHLVYSAAMVRDEGNQKGFSTLDELKHERIGVLSGSNHNDISLRVLGDGIELYYYENVADMIAAVRAHKIEGFTVDQATGLLAQKNNPDIKLIEEPLIPDNFGIVFPKGSPLKEDVDKALAQLKSNGEIDSICEKWFNGDMDNIDMPEQTWPGSNGTYTVYSQYDAVPFVCKAMGTVPKGIDIELILRIAEINDWRLRFVSADLTGCFTAVESGKTDIMLGAISITDERREKMDFSEPYYDGAVRMMVLDESFDDSSESFWTGLKNSFRKTFIVEDRWVMILDGLLVTFVISIFSGILGLLVGFGLCMLMRSRSKAVVKLTRGFIRIIQGMPIVVFLMILFYIVFAKVDISGIIVAIIGFAINFGAYVSMMMKTGIDSVGIGQSEAAEALGYSRSQSFFKVVFPQAAQHFIPIVKGEFISMVKMTSVVGFIAVQDLTKASDIIRARTMEAFFTLFVSAIIYFALANLLTMLLTMVEKKLNPKQRPRKIKGVND